MPTGTLPRRAIVLASLLAAAACGGKKHALDEYSFANRTMTSISLSQPAPGLLTSGYNIRDDQSITETVIQAGTTVAQNTSARRVRNRLDSAAARMNLSDDLAQRTLERTARYLGVRPVRREGDADYLLEIRIRSFGLDARRSTGATLYTNAEAVLLDRRSGREIWNVIVHGTDGLVPRVRGADGIPGAIVTAGSLQTLSVADFENALDQLITLSSNVIADELRAALRDVRRRR
jgi:hypothetical protein